MIKLTATALIHYISPVIEIPSKSGGQPFQKRELILNDSWERDGQTYPNFVVIEFSGDKMAQLDNFVPGQRVTIDAYVNGREHQGRVFNTIKGQTVTLYQPQQSNGAVQRSAPAPAPGYPSAPAYPQQAYPAPAPAPGYPQQAYGQHPGAAYPQQGYGQQQGQPSYGQQSHSPGVADLPFPPNNGV